MLHPDQEGRAYLGNQNHSVAIRVTGCCPRAAAAAAAWVLYFGSPLVAQTVGTVDIGASVVEYDGFLVSGAAVLSPALHFNAPNISVGAQGAWTVFESGNQVLQASAAAAWIAPSRQWWRVEFSGSVGASKYADETGYGHLLARARVHFFGQRAGGWVGGTTGGSFGESNRTPFELAVGGWSVRDRFTVVGTLTGTWLAGDGYVDLLGAARWRGVGVEVEARAGARPFAEGGGEVGGARTGVYGDASALFSLGEGIALQLSGGSYPSNPVRQVLAARYITAGVRLNIFGSEVSAVPTITDAMLRAGRDRAVSEDASSARLEIVPSRHPRTLRVHVMGAASVEMMGDFTDWQTVQLTRTGDTTWEIQLPLTRGVHRVNIRVDGGRWLVPAGTRLEQTEFGDAVGVVVIP